MAPPATPSTAADRTGFQKPEGHNELSPRRYHAEAGGEIVEDARSVQHVRVHGDPRDGVACLQHLVTAARAVEIEAQAEVNDQNFVERAPVAEARALADYDYSVQVRTVRPDELTKRALVVALAARIAQDADVTLEGTDGQGFRVVDTGPARRLAAATIGRRDAVRQLANLEREHHDQLRAIEEAEHRAGVHGIAPAPSKRGRAARPTGRRPGQAPPPQGPDRQKFGTLTVIDRAPNAGPRRDIPMRRCACDCGACDASERIVAGSNLRSGKTTTCGANRSIRQGCSRKTGVRPIYNAWVGVRRRGAVPA